VDVRADWRKDEDHMLNCDFAISAIREARSSLVDNFRERVYRAGLDDDSSAKAGARWKGKTGSVL